MINLIKDRIYVGSLAAAMNRDLLQQMKIRCIINCSGEEYSYPEESMDMVLYTFGFNRNRSIRDYCNEINQKIDLYVQREENVLIHCHYGHSRSCSCAICYFIWKYRWDYDRAFDLVNSQREGCDIPQENERYLREYANQELLGIEDKTQFIQRYECLLRITFSPDEEEERDQVMCSMKTYLSSLPTIVIRKVNWGDVVYGVRPIELYLSLPESMDFHEVEKELKNRLNVPNVLSINMEELID